MRHTKSKQGKGVSQGWTLYRGTEAIRVLWPADQGQITNNNYHDVALLWHRRGSGVVHTLKAKQTWDPIWGWGFLGPRKLSVTELLVAEVMGRWILTDSGLFVPAIEAKEIGIDIITAMVDLGATRPAA